MSGFEIAGIVLGAFPIAIIALEQYRKTATVLGFFVHIEKRHKDCVDKLSFQQLRLKSNLKELLLPLSVHYDQDRIEDLINNHGGPGWKDADVSEKLVDRLQDSYVLYLGYLEGMRQTMKQLNKALNVDTHSLQDPVQAPPASNEVQMQTPPVSRTHLKSEVKESWQSARYRIKFANGEGERNKLLGELETYNDNLEKLLSMSDKNVQLTKHFVKTRTSAVDLAICVFWRQAAKVFQTIAAAWTCPCRQHHQAKLQLQHRTNKTHDFVLLFETLGPAPHLWEKRRARVSKGTDPNQGVPSTRRGVSFSIPSPSTDESQSQSSTQEESDQHITSLCSSLEGMDRDCCGYLSHDEGRYYVYAEAPEDHGWRTRVTLEEVLKAPRSHRLSRWQSFTISMALASSFVQLLDTPWLPESLSKSDIVFFQDAQQKGRFQVDRPHVTCRFVNTTNEDRSSTATTVVESLENLGIILLELLFKDVLEEQPCRTQYKDGPDTPDIARRAFDVVAAHSWLKDAKYEAGIEYSEAIAWCLKGSCSKQGGPDEWRRDMVTNVIQPLQAELDHLKAGDRDGV